MNRRPPAPGHLARQALALLCLVPGLAAASTAVTNGSVNLRAGPDADYPLVRWLPEGTPVEVQGCIEDYRWCDVVVYGDRGWVHARYLSAPWQNSYQPIITYGAIIGLPLVGFTVGSYWDNYYPSRPWYPQRHRWADRPVYVVPAPRPHPVHPVHPGYRQGPDYRAREYRTQPIPPRPVSPSPSRPGAGPDYRPPAPLPAPSRPPGVRTIEPGSRVIDSRPPSYQPPLPRPQQIQAPQPRAPQYQSPQYQSPQFQSPPQRAPEARQPVTPPRPTYAPPGQPARTPQAVRQQQPESANNPGSRPPGVLR